LIAEMTENKHSEAAAGRQIQNSSYLCEKTDGFVRNEKERKSASPLGFQGRSQISVKVRLPESDEDTTLVTLGVSLNRERQVLHLPLA